MKLAIRVLIVGLTDLLLASPSFAHADMAAVEGAPLSRQIGTASVADGGDAVPWVTDGSSIATTVWATATAAVASPPSCGNVSVGAPGGAVSVAFRCGGAAGVALQYVVVTGPSHGSVSEVDQETASVSYIADPGYYGTDTLTYEATDSGGASNIATATIAILPPPPVCANLDAGTPGQGMAIKMFLPCSAPAASGLSFTIISKPSHGRLKTLSSARGYYVYMPDPSFSGSDRFTYRASDSGGSSNRETATIDVPLTTPTMVWGFGPGRRYTLVQTLAVSDLPASVHVLVFCRGGGCPFKSHNAGQAARSSCKPTHCAAKSRAAAGALDLAPLFAGRRLRAGARITVSLIKASTIGKAYVFVMRPSRPPAQTVSCVAPGATQPGPTC